MPTSFAGKWGARIGSPEVGEPNLKLQAAPVNYNGAATLAPSDLAGGLITFNGGAAANLTLPLATAVDAFVSNAQVNDSFEFSVISTVAFAATVVTNTGWTLVGNMAVPANGATQFRAVKNGSGAWTLYQLG